jgi:6-phosphogluconate dehydrogenase
MKKEIGFIGLGSMGLNMVYKLLDEGYTVHAWNRSEGSRSEAKTAGAMVYESVSEMANSISGTERVFWSMVSAGPAVDEVLSELKKHVKKSDIIVEGANSFYEDSVRRHNEFEKLGVYYFDAGVSGGLGGARNGSCIMVGGDKEIFEKHLEQIVKDLAIEDGYGYFGEPGAGHYVKMVHNAIEYAMMQAMGEGMNLISKSQYKAVDFEKLTDVWNHGSIIEGRLMGFLKEALSKNPNLKDTDSEIGSLGTGEWSVREALKNGVPFPTIAGSVFARYNSRGNDEFSAKVVQALRVEFGGHNSQERPQN